MKPTSDIMALAPVHPWLSSFGWGSSNSGCSTMFHGAMASVLLAKGSEDHDTHADLGVKRFPRCPAHLRHPFLISVSSHLLVHTRNLCLYLLVLTSVDSIWISSSKLIGNALNRFFSSQTTRILRPFQWGKKQVGAEKTIGTTSARRAAMVTGGGGLAMPLTSVMSFLSNSWQVKTINGATPLSLDSLCHRKS